MSTLPPPLPHPTPTRHTSGLAIASFVLGVLWLGFVGSVLALVFGIVSYEQIRRSSGALGGKGFAVAGIVLGAIPIGFVWMLYST